MKSAPRRGELLWIHEHGQEFEQALGRRFHVAKEIREARLGVAFEPAREREPARAERARKRRDFAITEEGAHEGAHRARGRELLREPRGGLSEEALEPRAEVDTGPSREAQKVRRGRLAAPRFPRINDVGGVAEATAEGELGARAAQGDHELGGEAAHVH